MKAEDDEYLARICTAVVAAKRADDELSASVADARSHGMTWEQIATLLGTSRQAAAERYGSTK